EVGERAHAAPQLLGVAQSPQHGLVLRRGERRVVVLVHELPSAPDGLLITSPRSAPRRFAISAALRRRRPVAPAGRCRIPPTMPRTPAPGVGRTAAASPPRRGRMSIDS